MSKSPNMQTSCDATITATFNFADGGQIQIEGVDVATVDDEFNKNSNYDIGGQWHFDQVPDLQTALFSTDHETSSAGRRGAYLLEGDIGQTVHLTLGLDDLYDLSFYGSDNLEGAVWNFLATNYSDQSYVIQTEVMTGCNAASNGGHLMVETIERHPFSQGSEVYFEDFDGHDYGHNHTVVSRNSDTSFTVNADYSKASEFNVRPTIISLTGNNSQSFSLGRLESRTFCCDGMNFRTNN